MTRILSSIVALCTIAACTEPDQPSSPEEGPPRLVAAYDITAVSSLGETEPHPFVWMPPEIVSQACGVAKAPTWLGSTEASLLAQRKTPALALLFEHPPSSKVPEPMRLDRLRIYLESEDPKQADEKPPEYLQPAVVPYEVRVLPEVPEAAEELLLSQTVFFQLTVQLCAEHKVGRVWIGHNESDRIRESIRLMDPDGHPSTRFFLEQGPPVPAFLGPPVWSIEMPPDAPSWLSNLAGESDGESAITSEIVQSDIWGARAPLASRAQYNTQTQSLPFMAGQGAACAPSGLAKRLGMPSDWSCVRPVSANPQELRVSLEVDPQDPNSAKPLASIRALGSSEPWSPLLERAETLGSTEADEVRGGVSPDQVARLPRYLPQFRSQGEEGRTWSLAVIPEWQLARALRALDSADGNTPLLGALGSSRLDSIGYLLTHPSLLRVQYDPSGMASGELGDLATPMRRTLLSQFGFFPGIWALPNPVFLVQDTNISPIEPAQHATVYHRESAWISLLGAALFLYLVPMAVRRLPELWQEPPTERAAYWPGRREGPEGLGDADKKDKEGDGDKDTSGGGGGDD